MDEKQNDILQPEEQESVLPPPDTKAETAPMPELDIAAESVSATEDTVAEAPPVSEEIQQRLDEMIAASPAVQEIQADEQAISGTGLTSISDLDLDKIIEETLSDDWEPDPQIVDTILEEAASPAKTESFRDDEYRDTFGEEDTLSQIFREVTGQIPEVEAPPAEDPRDIPVPSNEVLNELMEEVKAEAEKEEAKEDPVDPPQPRKVRPKRKGGYGLFGIPHLLSIAIWLCITVAIGVSLGRLIWVCAADVLAFGREDKKVSITISNSDDLESITKKLHNAGLIKYPGLFKFYAGLSKAEEDISVGTFELNTLFDYHALVASMSSTSSYRETVEVMIPEGYTCAQIFSLLEEKGVCSVADLEEYAANGTINDRWFLAGVKRGDKYCLEGYLFPDTYEFYTDDTPARIFGKLLDSFGSKLESMPVDFETQLAELNQRLSAMMKKNGYTQSYIDQHQMTIREIVIIASMIEKESGNSQESYTISSVIYNRLTNPDYPMLNIDATIVYALGGKTDLTPEDLKIDHPYNTYTNPGLTPGAISNPGLASLYAALDPDETQYYYYALNPEVTEYREHKFFKTYKEHLEFLESIRK